jgi:MYXO-CTERM domain-containing protein
MTATDVQMTGSNSAIQEVDLTTLGQITASGPFRVAFEWQHAGYPSVARDADGNTYPDRNYIYAIPGGWIRSSAAMVAGDWVIRAFVVYSGDTDGGVQEDAAVVQEDAAPAQSDAAAQHDGGGNQSCQGNTDCPGGQYCGPQNVCTYDCVIDTDCGDNATCNSLGKCVDKGSSGCGCAAPGARPAGLVLALALVGLGLGALRRRRRR